MTDQPTIRLHLKQSATTKNTVVYKPEEDLPAVDRIYVGKRELLATFGALPQELVLTLSKKEHA